MITLKNPPVSTSTYYKQHVSDNLYYVINLKSQSVLGVLLLAQWYLALKIVNAGVFIKNTLNFSLLFSVCVCSLCFLEFRFTEQLHLLWICTILNLLIR